MAIQCGFLCQMRTGRRRGGIVDLRRKSVSSMSSLVLADW
jgi:hypothetical protein